MEDTPNSSPEPPLAEESLGESPFLAVSPLIEYYQPPRLGIIHLLAWITLGIVLFKINQALEMLENPLLREPNRIIALAHRIRNYCNDILGAALVVGGALLAIDLFRRKQGVFQPGHWLVVINASIFLLGLVVNSTMLLFVSERSSLFPFLMLNVAVSTIVLLVYFRVFFSLARQFPWQIAILLFAVQEFLKATHIAFLAFVPNWTLNTFLISQWFKVPVALFILLVMGIDIARGFRRDWLHWLGAVCVASDLLLDILWFITTHYVASSI